ncbi:MAG: ATP-binding cassette domain-containing protein [Sandaracinaceae bacterium]
MERLTGAFGSFSTRTPFPVWAGRFSRRRGVSRRHDAPVERWQRAWRCGRSCCGTVCVSARGVCLRLSDYGVTAGQRPLLADIDLTVTMRGITLVLGPAGAGKSTLLRSVCGEFDSSPNYRISGRVEYRGEPRAPGKSPHLVRQRLSLVSTTIENYLVSAHPDGESFQPMERSFHIETSLREIAGFGLDALWATRLRPVLEVSAFKRKCLALARAVVADAALVCLDETFRDARPEEVSVLLAMVERIAQSRAVLAVTHHQGHARRLGGDAVLLAGGRLWARQSTEHFFGEPINELVENFVRTGGCPVPSLAAQPEHLSEEFVKYVHPSKRARATAGGYRRAVARCGSWRGEPRCGRRGRAPWPNPRRPGLFPGARIASQAARRVRVASSEGRVASRVSGVRAARRLDALSR